MYKFARGFIRTFCTFKGNYTNDKRLLGVTSIALAGSGVLWVAPTTLLDDGRGSRGGLGVNTLAPSNISAAGSDDIAQRKKAWKAAYASAVKDVNAARQATFAQAESLLKKGPLKYDEHGSLPLDEHMSYIFNIVGISPEDTRIWTLKRNSQDSQQIRAVCLAVNVQPDIMENHLIITAALQMELDRWRKAGKLDSSNMILAIIQYRDLTVELEYKKDGRFTPVLRHPLTGKRLPFDPLERMYIKVREDGVPQLLPETAEQAISYLDLDEDS
jgi:hypothetical protein